MKLFKEAKAELIRSNVDRRHPFRYLQLATQTELYPELRTLVKRNFGTDWSFLLYTDIRSPKVKEIISSPKVSLHCYHPKKQLQIRVKGTAQILEEGPLWEEEYRKVQSSPSIKDYTTTIAPSTPLSSTQAIEYGEDLFFGLLKIEAVEVDILQLSRAGHQRILAKKEGATWIFSSLVP